MKAGQLRHTVTIKEPVASRNTYGEESITWTDVVTDLRVGIRPKSAKEEIEAHQVEHEITHRVAMRYRDDIGPKMRLYYGDRVLEIKSIVNVGERNRELRLLCVEVKDE